jgi:arsenate reductase (glutaredoxin)
VAYLLLHNPRCSKSRAALAILEQSGAPFAVRPYLEQPLSLDELRILKGKLGHPRDWLRFQEPEAAGLSRDDPPMVLLQAMAKHPRLMQRPILMDEERAIVAREEGKVKAFIAQSGRN